MADRHGAAPRGHPLDRRAHVIDDDSRAQARRAERLASLGFLTCAAAAVGLAVVYWTGGQPQLEGTLLAGGVAGPAPRVVTLGEPPIPPRPVSQDPPEMGPPPPERQAVR